MTVRIHDLYTLKDVATAHNVSLGIISFAERLANKSNRIWKAERVWASYL